ncbi:unnamed protein product [Prorocentrum cordatum]|uniref:Peptidylprolyl isomerase n=1 Tax=Prorocentrum cordatum TaxID=2364126 RepID=A0ABN9QN33_9DINO|nr:unnamed protein product [Polarella glacialis]
MPGGGATGRGVPGGALGAATPAGGDPEEVELRLAAVKRLPRGLGSVRIRLRGDLSGKESVDYVRRIGVDPASAVRSGALQFYRAERGLLLQGEMRSSGVQGEERKGPCPPDVDPDVNRKKGRKCFPHDPDCGCHGPIMLPGMVGWAGGAGKGPHFFIYVGDGPNTFWGHDHTVWGQLADEQSMNAVKAVLDLPVSSGGGMRMLKQKVPFELRLSTR